MKRFFQSLFFSLSVFTFSNSQAQAAEWKDVASIFYSNCTTCHRPGEIGADYILATGYTALKNSPFFYSIPTQINSGLMPPWKADPNYRHFLDERILEQNEKDLISAWVNADGPAGDTTLAPPPPVFSSGSQLGTPDLTLTMAQPYTVPGDFTDHYIVFVLPTGLTEDKVVSAFELRPGTGQVVHHAFIYTCNDGSAAAMDSTTPEYGYPSFGGAGESVNVDFIGLYGPGMTPRFYPPGTGKKIKAGSDMVIQIHYAPIDHEEIDQSSINLFFSNDDQVRNVKAKRVGEQYIEEPVFFIPKEKVLTFHEDFPIDTDYSLITIAAHMHLLGKTYKIWAEYPTGDSIPLLYIPLWDFHWQLGYSFPFMVKLPAGTVIHAEATYDNTENNPNNPNNPPINVGYGESSTDEMFKFFMNLVPYLPGDEDIVLDSSWHPSGIPPTSGGLIATPQLYPPSPDPVTDQLSISYYIPSIMGFNLYVYDLSGRLVMPVMQTKSSGEGLHRNIIDVSKFVPGVYFCTLEAGGAHQTKRFVVQH